jgi:hypothetical protein
MAKKRAGGSSAPETWIGRDVVIGVDASGARVSGELREVSDRGVVLHYGTDQGRAPATSSTLGAMCQRSSSPTKNNLGSGE